jgi:hypothetical protein
MSSSRAVALLCFVLFTACPAPKPPPAPEPGPLQAGVATRRLDLPVGIAMGGYLRQRPVSDPGSNWAEQFPASQGIHTEPTVRVVALTNGLTRVALIRLDATITSPTLRSRLVGSLTAAGESANVFMYATHSHAAPARFMPPARLGSATGTDFVSLVMDHYDAEAETRMTSAIVAAITEAFSTLKPVSLGVASVEAGDFNNDRRCENDPIYGPDFRDTALTVIRIDEVDASGQPVKPLTALLHYAMHGTVLGSDNTLQSTEGPGPSSSMRRTRWASPRCMCRALREMFHRAAIRSITRTCSNSSARDAPRRRWRRTPGRARPPDLLRRRPGSTSASAACW